MKTFVFSTRSIIIILKFSYFNSTISPVVKARVLAMVPQMTIHSIVVRGRIVIVLKVKHVGAQLKMTKSLVNQAIGNAR